MKVSQDTSVWTEILVAMTQTQEDLFCVVKYTVGEVCFGAQIREPGGMLSVFLLSKEPSLLLPETHFIKSISTFL